MEHLEQRWTIAHDLLEVVFRAQFLPEINIFFFQHNLVRHLLQEHGVLVRIASLFPAYQAERADTLSLENQGHHAHRLDTLFSKAALIEILLLFFKIATHERMQMFEYPAAAGVAATKFQPRLKVVREQISLDREETERISLRLIEGNRASVEREERMQGLGNGMQQCLLG